MPEQLVNLKEAAAQLDMRPKGLRNWTTQGKIEHVKLGGSIKFKQSTIDAVIERATIKPTRSVEVAAKGFRRSVA